MSETVRPLGTLPTGTVWTGESGRVPWRVLGPAPAVNGRIWGIDCERVSDGMRYTFKPHTPVVPVD